MSLQELVDLTIINFKHPLNLEETEKLFEYVSNTMLADVRYKTEYFKNFLYDLETNSSEKDIGTLSISGQILKKESPFTFAHFNTEHSFKCDGKIILLKFDLIPGYDSLREYENQTKELWAETKKKINSFFLTEYKMIIENKPELKSN
ncbi:hypothetical protein HOK68_00575 [Candidatus Woesearchaeota archaeon]|jgi:hypothetical protein|nr:hypothetical protein [Candidatus Woesearchaeota archaeon]MBT4387585.1 hypothetical protein [Candidatus Woesearchaeota archaeon]MBT4595901.1 hypothetical protein [Candidatus Woesearchaeota archaeon]MBT5741031.1 hypothetical protein [Candidatus Woesearchaeota archaeon]MBT6505256.1 hypothetical protein [Candidatus Woesearchaeota archaeon]